MSDITSVREGGRLLVVTYHYVREQGGLYPGIHPVTREDLAQQIIRLKDKFHAVDLSEVIEFSQGLKPLKRDSFLITFDDGLQDHYLAAKDVLRDLGIKGAFFVPTRPQHDGLSPAVHKIHWLRAHTEPSCFNALLRELLPGEWSNFELSDIDKKRAAEMHIHDVAEVQILKFALNFIIPYNVVDAVMSKMLVELGVSEAEFCQMTFMDYSQMRELIDDGHIIGLHGHDHVPFSVLDRDNIDKDITKNAEALKSALNYQPRWLSYPYGRPDAIPAEPCKFCQRYDIDVAFTLSSGFNKFGDDKSLFKRITPNELDQFFC